MSAVRHLSRPPAGLADGLALKELARLRLRRFAPVIGSPVPLFSGFGVRGRLADHRNGTFVPPLAAF